MGIYKLIIFFFVVLQVDSSKKLAESIIYFRIIEEVNRNVAEENIEILRKIEKVNNFVCLIKHLKIIIMLIS